MSYTFVKISSFYRDYLTQYYSKNPYIIKTTYKEQYEHLMHDAFSWSDNYQRNFIDIGIEAYEIIGNATHLQNAWAKEHNTDKKGLDLVLTQLKKMNPDVIFIQDPVTFNGSWINTVKEKIPSIKKIIGHLCSPFSNNQLELFINFDFMTTCSKYFQDRFEKAGIKTYHINHAFDPSILKKINIFNNSIHSSDLLFIGSLIASKDMHDFRTLVIEELLKTKLDIEIHTKLNYDNNIILFTKQTAYILTKFLTKIGLKETVSFLPYLKKFVPLNELPHNMTYSQKLINISKEPLYGLKMYEALANANSVLNIHGGVGGAKFAANIRLFEVTGVGTCLITDWKENLHELFEPEKEVVTFKSVEECIEKVKWLRDHPNERKEIAKAGQKRTLKNHTYAIRIQKLNEIIQDELKKN